MLYIQDFYSTHISCKAGNDTYAVYRRVQMSTGTVYVGLSYKETSSLAYDLSIAYPHPQTGWGIF
jgi:hypothetical protein